ncbi:hypothetical protein [Bradyrhizobium sp. Ai1a-2]|uniref:hypothetical protein n=1 Tax=Bradyrhizobium sp. Ai1a-2 TaxID=196490 RepID=UPI0004855261|nr:hypothetical protein [Bradyrhizobium sp. Ai1a-2]
MPKLTESLTGLPEGRDKDYRLRLRVLPPASAANLSTIDLLERSRRYTIGLNEVSTAESERQDAKVQWIAKEPNQAGEGLEHKTIIVKERCALHINDLNVSLTLERAGCPKKPITIATDKGRRQVAYYPVFAGPTSTNS